MSLFAFGSNVSFQFGSSDVINTCVPQKIAFFEDKKIITLETGYLHSFALTDQGLFSWGCNDDGQLGREGNEEDFLEVKFPKIVTGRFMDYKNIVIKNGKVQFQNKVEIKKIQAGGSFSAFLTKKGHLFITGTFRNSRGVFGLTKSTKNSFMPIPVMSRVKDIMAGKDFLLIHTNNNDLYAIGNNDFNQIRDYTMRNKESLVPKLISTKVKFFGCGASHLVFITKNLNVYARGLDNSNQTNLPFEIKELTNENACKIIGGSYTTYLLIDDLLYSLGMNKDGQLGLGKKSNFENFSYVTKEVEDIKCKMDFVLFKNKDELFTFGASNFGENGFEDDKLSPTKLNFKEVKNFAAGADFSLVEGELL
ncbi:alpha-tubulin suppressor [Tubulinosema ratisbonensis]|uniref:Alpha-tubulin suppressor n=1 Tax=Tubulinosema ratisbonensis TaxID=291195 RepID=A0A437AQD9_9MICR|nr:alpha-tubulin suppressor [Tubulinosema ratisbonensis]